jgi:hypothetical protein
MEGAALSAPAPWPPPSQVVSDFHAKPRSHEKNSLFCGLRSSFSAGVEVGGGVSVVGSTTGADTKVDADVPSA